MVVYIYVPTTVYFLARDDGLLQRDCVFVPGVRFDTVCRFIRARIMRRPRTRQVLQQLTRRRCLPNLLHHHDARVLAAAAAGTRRPWDRRSQQQFRAPAAGRRSRVYSDRSCTGKVKKNRTIKTYQ